MRNVISYIIVELLEPYRKVKQDRLKTSLRKTKNTWIDLEENSSFKKNLFSTGKCGG